jgi:hypothetical protein
MFLLAVMPAFFVGFEPEYNFNKALAIYSSLGVRDVRLPSTKTSDGMGDWKTPTTVKTS